MVFLLREDPDLAERIPPDERERATELLRVRVFTVPEGEWEPPRIDHGSIGLLLLTGLMVRKIYLGAHASADLIGPGDIGRPWEDDLIPGLSPYLSEWIVLKEARVAHLDERVTRAMGHWPELGAMVAARFVRRSRSLAYLMAAHSFRRIEHRLLAALWHLGAIWGRVTPHGIRVPFRLTHEMLAEIVSARRPSVSVAMGELEREGLVSRDPNGCYLLHGDAPDWRVSDPPVAEVEA